MIILDDKVESGLDSNVQITLLNQRTHTHLLVITTKEEFLFNIQKFMSQ